MFRDDENDINYQNMSSHCSPARSGRIHHNSLVRKSPSRLTYTPRKEKLSSSTEIRSARPPPFNLDRGDKRDGDVLGIIKRRRARPSLLGWLSMLVFFALIRSLWNSISFSRLHWESSNYDSSFIDFPRLDGGSVFRRPMRRSRQRRPPPSPVSTGGLNAQPVYPMIAANQIVLSGERSQQSSERRSFCGDISSNSRILLSGILSHPLGSEITFALVHQCGVETIVGLTHHDLDVEASMRLAYLLRNLPTIQMHTLKVPLTETKMKDIFSLATFTHVIHLEPTSFLPSELRLPPLYAMRSSIDILESLCKRIVKQRIGGEKTKLVYVTAGDQNEQLLSKAINEIYPMILQTYRSLYDIHTVHLKLPNIYGPFRQGASWIDDNFLTGNITSSTTKIERQASMMYITESVESVIQSAAMASISFVSLVPPDDQSTTLVGLLTDPDQLSKDRLAFMISFYHKNEHPYTDTSVHERVPARIIKKAIVVTNQHLSLISNNDGGISQLQRRQNGLFPCDSECAIQVPCQAKSPWSTILPTIQNVTTDCRFVIYTVDFSRQLDDLPAMQEPEAESPQNLDLLCQVAFVSWKSKLANSLVSAEKKSQPNANLRSSDLNGKLSHNRWRLVWLQHDDKESLTEANYMMPKIAPGNFFSKNVTKAFYLEPNIMKSIPPLQLIWILLAKSLDAKGQKGPQRKRIFRSGTAIGQTVAFPPAPARHIALFAHSFNISDAAMEDYKMETIAKFILKQKGLEPEDIWPRSQLQYYDHALEMYDFDPVDTFLLIHNLQSDRSRQIRCEWYEEHLFWSDRDKRNRNLEDLSLSFILARRRSENRLVYFDEQWGERVVETSKGDVLEVDPWKHSPSQYFVKVNEPMKARKQYTLN